MKHFEINFSNNNRHQSVHLFWYEENDFQKWCETNVSILGREHALLDTCVIYPQSHIPISRLPNIALFLGKTTSDTLNFEKETRRTYSHRPAQPSRRSGLLWSLIITQIPLGLTRSNYLPLTFRLRPLLYIIALISWFGIVSLSLSFSLYCYARWFASERERGNRSTAGIYNRCAPVPVPVCASRRAAKTRGGKLAR